MKRTAWVIALLAGLAQAQAPNPITLQTVALNWYQVALSWNDISASGADSVRLSWDTVPVPLGVQQVSTPWVWYCGADTTAVTVSGLSPATCYYFSAQAHISGEWTLTSAAASARDSTVDIDTVNQVPNTVSVRSARFDSAQNRLVIDWHYRYSASMAVHYGYVAAIDSVATLTGMPAAWQTATSADMVTYIPLGEDIVFDTAYHVSFRLKRADRDPSYASPVTDSATARVRSGPISWEPICYFRSPVGDTVWAFNRKVAMWYDGTWAYGWAANRDTLDVYRAVPPPAGFIPVSVGFSARQNLDFPAVTMALRYDSVPSRLRAEDIRAYRRTSAGLWMVVGGQSLNAAAGMVTFHSKFLPGEALMLMIDTLAPVHSMVSNPAAVLSAGTVAYDTVQLSDNCANMHVQFAWSRAELAPRLVTDSTVSRTSLTYTTSVPGTYVTETGLRAYLVISDGRFTDTVNLSRQVRRPQASDIATEAGRWVPLRTTAVLDNPLVAPMIQALTGQAAYDTSRCRVVRWFDPNSSDDVSRGPHAWAEYADVKAMVFALLPGKLMWVRASTTTILDIGGGVTTSGQQDATITLPPRSWTDFAVPHRYPVFLAEMLRATGAPADSLWFCRWSLQDTVPVARPMYAPGMTDSLSDPATWLGADARQAYSVYNALPSAVTLHIPPVCTAMTSAAGPLPEPLHELPWGSWYMRISSSQAPDVLIGRVRVGGSRTWVAQPPSFARAGVRLYDRTASRAYGYAIDHSVDQEWLSYELELYNDGDQPRVITFGPSDLRVWSDSLVMMLVDGVSGNSRLFNGPVQATVAAHGKQYWMLSVYSSVPVVPGVAGTVRCGAPFVRAQQAGAGVAIRYALPRAWAGASVTVSDLLGRVVWRRQVGAGAGLCVWPGGCSQAAGIGDGVYVVRIVPRGAQQRPLQAKLTYLR